MEVFLAFVIGVAIGIAFCIMGKKQDGRFVIDDDSYFVAITTSPDDLKKRKWVNMRVFVKGAQK